MRTKTIPKIRKMKRADAEVVAEMMAALAAYHGHETRIGAAEFVARGLGSKKLTTIWIATVDREPAGFAATFDWMNFVRAFRVRHIDLLFVSERFRGQGVGTALLANILKDANASGCLRATVGVANENGEAREFYRKLGFQQRRDDSLRFQYEILDDSRGLT
jgi:ribosomal protein S18 acetylase RimI-like enzyme